MKGRKRLKPWLLPQARGEQAEDRRVPPDRVPVEPIDRLPRRVSPFRHEPPDNEGNVASRKPNVFEDGIRQFVEQAAHPVGNPAVARSWPGQVILYIGHCGLHAFIC